MSRGEHKRNLCGTNQAQGPRLSHSLPINSEPSQRGDAHRGDDSRRGSTVLITLHAAEQYRSGNPDAAESSWRRITGASRPSFSLSSFESHAHTHTHTGAHVRSAESTFESWSSRTALKQFRTRSSRYHVPIFTRAPRGRISAPARRSSGISRRRPDARRGQ